MRSLNIALFFIMCLLIACTMTPEEARKKLEQKNISYTEDAFEKAIKDNDTEVVNLFLAAGADPNINVTNRPALIWATELENEEVVKGLLDRGADVNSRTTDGDTPLIIAARHQSGNILKLLIENGADVNAAAHNGNTPLTWATIQGGIETMKILIENGADVNIGKPLLRTRSFDEVQLLIDSGADLNVKTKDGRTVLMELVRSHREPYPIKFLLDNGADVNAADMYGNNALMIAIPVGEIEIIRMLLDEGADLNARTDTGDTALNIAAKNNNISLMQLFIERGAVVDGETLVAASCVGHAQVVKFLLERDDGINADSKSARDALMCAAGAGNASVLQILLNWGADVNARDARNDKTALISAAMSGHDGAVKVLLEKKADANAGDLGGYTALYWAREKGHPRIEQMLEQAGGSGLRDIKPEERRFGGNWEPVGAQNSMKYFYEPSRTVMVARGVYRVWTRDLFYDEYYCESSFVINCGNMTYSQVSSSEFDLNGEERRELHNCELPDNSGQAGSGKIDHKSAAYELARKICM